MKTKKLLFSLCLAMLAPHAFATGEAEQASKDKAESTVMSASETPTSEDMARRCIAGTFIATITCAMIARKIIKTIHTDVSTCLTLS